MHIFKIEIDNFRLLKNFSLDLEQELSLVIGKNNTGKTSILVAIDKFINYSDKTKFVFDDFNIEYKKKLKELIESEIQIEESEYISSGLKLKLYIEYNELDNLANISRVIMDLDPANNIVVLGFEHMLSYIEYVNMRKDFLHYKSIENEKLAANSNYSSKGVFDFLKQNQQSYFKQQRKSFVYNIHNSKVDETNYLDLLSEEISIRDIINFKFISARRDVTNKDIDKTLSSQTSKIYEKAESTEGQLSAVQLFKDRLIETDSNLSDIYKNLFADIISKVSLFGGIRKDESAIEIISTLQHRELLRGNTTVVYKHDEEHRLPEHYNGLGYMNLISMIFEIEILVHDFQRDADKKPADINLLIIEEPEAHTHPQMQYVFIKNIKKLLSQGIKTVDGNQRALQYIITTHSCHIVADSDFNDIKYLKKAGVNGVSSKNLKDLAIDYELDTDQYNFLTQYLTISRAEIFFADKAVLIEGDTERILVPTLMRKIDIEEKLRFETEDVEDPSPPLLSQNVSIMEVGAYSHIFEKFIDFLGIKSLIITDLDAIDATRKAVPIAEGTGFSNAALSYFYGETTLDALKAYDLTQKCFTKNGHSWHNDPAGNLTIVYQTQEQGYHARSFEDAFIHINRDFITGRKDSFVGLKNRNLFDDHANDAYMLAENCVRKKTHFAMDIIYNSDDLLSNWRIPNYIKEGLLWLKQG